MLHNPIACQAHLPHSHGASSSSRAHHGARWHPYESGTGVGVLVGGQTEALSSTGVYSLRFRAAKLRVGQYLDYMREYTLILIEICFSRLDGRRAADDSTLMEVRGRLWWLGGRLVFFPVANVTCPCPRIAFV
jgi:hypothetical protein